MDERGGYGAPAQRGSHVRPKGQRAAMAPSCSPKQCKGVCVATTLLYRYTTLNV
jgi:hypothetical protein